MLFSSHWLLHQLVTFLDLYMMHKCIHMKFGTVLFRRGGDIWTALSWPLSNPPSTNRCSVNVKGPKILKRYKSVTAIVTQMMVNLS